MSKATDVTVSLRWIRPFIRVTGADPLHLPILQREGITARGLVDADTRIRHRAMMEMLEASLQRTNNVALGLQAGEAVEPGDMDVLEYAARSCATLREAIHSTNRYMELMHGGQRATLREEGDYASWEIHDVDEVPRPAASNDFALTAACTFARRYTGVRAPLRAVHFRHEAATDEAAYARIFDGAEIKLAMPHNALVFAREQLELPMLHANAGFRTAFEQHASALLERVKRSEGVSGRVRQLLVQHLRSGDVSMTSVARRLAMSVPTLRRRLTEEGTTHSQLLDDVRRELADKYLADRSVAIGEVAFLLGFSHVTAFYKAFTRWSVGLTPRAYRAQSRRSKLSKKPVTNAFSSSIGCTLAWRAFVPVRQLAARHERPARRGQRNTWPQNPPMQRPTPAQQSSSDSHASSPCEHSLVGGPQTPSLQKPLQQSMPDSQPWPSARHGSSAAKARWFAPSSSWPGT